MKVEEIAVKFEEGDLLRVNSNGIFIEHHGRLYLALVRPENIPRDGLVTFRDYGSPEEGQAVMTFAYHPNRDAGRKSLF